MNINMIISKYLFATMVIMTLIVIPVASVDTIAYNSTGNTTAWDSTNGILTEPNGNANISLSTGQGNTTIFVTLDTRLNATNSVLYAQVTRDGSEIARYAISSSIYEQTTAFVVNQTETTGTHHYTLKVYATAGKKATVYKWSMTAIYLQAGNYSQCTDCPNATAAIANNTANAASITANNANATALIANNTANSKPNNLSQLNDVYIYDPVIDQVVKYNGAYWVNGNGTSVSAGAGVNFFYNNTASDIGGYEIISRLPDTSTPEQDESTIVNTNTVQFEQYISPTGGIGGTQIDAGVWNFNIYTYVSSTTGNTQLLFNISKATADGENKTQLFNISTGNITNTIAGLYIISTVQPAFTINSTDRLIINVSGTTTAITPTTVHFLHSGINHYSYVSTPLIFRHNDAAAKQGGDGTNFFHLGQIPYVNLTTYDLADSFPFANPGYVTNATMDRNASNLTNPLACTGNMTCTYNANGSVSLDAVSNTTAIFNLISNTSTITVGRNANGSVELTATTAGGGFLNQNVNTSQNISQNITRGSQTLSAEVSSAIRYMAINISQNINVSAIFLNVATAGSNVRVAIYNTSATTDEPIYKLTETADIPMILGRNNNYSLTKSIILNGSSRYWIAFQQNNATGAIYYDASHIIWTRTENQAYGAFPQNAGVGLAAWTATGHVGVYGNLTGGNTIERNLDTTYTNQNSTSIMVQVVASFSTTTAGSSAMVWCTVDGSQSSGEIGIVQGLGNISSQLNCIVPTGKTHRVDTAISGSGTVTLNDWRETGI